MSNKPLRVYVRANQMNLPDHGLLEPGPDPVEVPDNEHARELIAAGALELAVAEPEKAPSEPAKTKADTATTPKES